MNFEKLKDFLDYYLPMLGVPGSDTVIYQNHEEIFRHQSGFDNLKYRTPVRPDAIYTIYSCTKIATCVAALQLIERGEILINDPLHVYFPEFKNLTVARKGADGKIRTEKVKKSILIRDLFSMTSGLDYNIRRSGIERVKQETEGKCPTLSIVRALADDPLLFEPGERYNYGLSHDVLGGIVELISGMKLGDYMKKHIFEPLGMKDTTFDISPDNYDRIATQYVYDNNLRAGVEIPKDSNRYRFGTEYQSGGAGLISSVKDQILFADALANYGVAKNGNRILSKAGVELMSSNHLDPVSLADFTKIGQVKGYGYGYGVRSNLTPTLNGNLSPVGEFGWDGARGSYFSCDPKNRVAFFYAEHMGGLHHVLLPRLRNVVYSCLNV